MSRMDREKMMLSQWMRKIVMALLLACIVAWWVPKLFNPPRLLPTPVKKLMVSWIPPHIDPNAMNEHAPDVVAAESNKSVAKNVRWAVQIGSYRSLKQIKPTIEQLKAQGYTVVVHPVSTQQGKLYRVWVGELTSHHAAKDLSLELKQKFQLQGFVLRLANT